MPDLAWDRLLVNLRAATMVPGGAPYGEIADAAIALSGDRIAWIGRARDIPADRADVPRTDLGGHLATPGLIDCHTHLVFA
ncbi:MAG: imidazolonepropionase, partial [Rhodospirillales bacterium]